jgi:translation initiation factor IF-2
LAAQQKRRVHLLAKELNVSSKVIVQKCKDEGIDVVKNHMSTLSAGLEATIREWFSEESQHNAVETSAPVDLKKVRVKPRRKKAKAAADTAAPQAEDDALASTAVAEPMAPSQPAEPMVTGEVSAPPMPTTEAVPAEDEQTSTVESTGAEAAAAEVVEPPAEVAAAVDVDGTVETDEFTAPEEVEVIADGDQAGVIPEAGDDAEEKEGVKAVGEQHVPAPAKLQGPRVVRYEPLESDAHPIRRQAPRRPAAEAPSRSGGGPPSPGQAPPSDSDRGGRRGRSRGGKRSGRVHEVGAGGGWGDRDLAERQERLADAGGRRLHRRRAVSGGGGGGGAAPSATGPKTQATVTEPVRMKDFCSATGLSFIQLFKVLRDEHNTIGNINMNLSVETAELLALGFGIELTVIPAKTKLDEVQDLFAQRERKNLKTRPPVVAMLGHVDHGKTSLLDAIRKTRVASREDGGITQHIGAHYVDTPHGRVTFLDTPGHEAFTAMRARGAKVTDVVVLVVAADDGLMPQTIEAINHAKAAEVTIVVALNKIDLGDQNKLKIYGQLAEHGLTPSGDWGGDIDVIETSATTGQGIEELVSHLSDLSNLLELKADAGLPADGIVLEAETKPGVGAVVRALIREGTLKVGSFVVCGNASGKVRALLDDQGQRIKSAGPSIPVEVWGLDDVPNAGDQLYQLDSLQRCKEVAAETKHDRIEENRQQSRKVKTLEEMFQQRDSDEIPELNVIIKADVDGSLVALRQMLAEFPTDEVRLTLRHMGVGAVNDSDVLLAATCQGIIVAFRVEASVGARRHAEQHGVEIRPYRVIYNVCDDIKKALEGLLAPEERPETRGTAEVREVFHLSRGKGVVAGSFITDGVIDRSHFAKVIRDGVLVREGCKFASLRRFKDDVNEVRKGMECGIRLEGFDDIHAGDVIETYEILKIARTLNMEQR